MTRTAPILLAALSLAACGHKPVLSQDAFRQAAQDCHAQHASYTASPVKDGPPSISVEDNSETVNGQQSSVARCMSAKMAPYQYTQIQLQAPPRPGH